jgi:hypothetical protein
MTAYPLHMTIAPQVQAFFDPATNTISYIVKDPASTACAIVDSVMDIDYAAGRITYDHADAMIAEIEAQGLALEWIIETHVHADHLSAAPYRSSTGGGARYDRATLSNDLMAAVIVTIMLIPQSLAYALLAGLPPEAGLYASIAADRALCDLRHQPGAGGGAGGGGVADDGLGRGAGRAAGHGGLCGGGADAGLPVGRRSCWPWGCCGWGSWPISCRIR